MNNSGTVQPCVFTNWKTMSPSMTGAPWRIWRVLAPFALCLCWFLGFTRAGAPSRFMARSRLFEWEVGLSEISSNGHVAAFGDFNGDKHTDVVVIEYSKNDMESKTTIYVYYWNPDLFSFQVTNHPLVVEMTVANVIAADFNRDGKLDILIQGNEGGASLVKFQVFLGDSMSIIPECIVQDDAMDQVTLIDWNGDLRVDLLGKNILGERTVWINKEVPESALSFERTPAMQNEEPLPRFHSPHSNSFVDLSGDCFPELFITSESTVIGAQRFEIWSHSSSEWSRKSWSSENFFEAPRGSGQVSFVDVDGDGNLDIVFPVCWPKESCEEENSIHIIYNQQMSLCVGKESSNCRRKDNLCVEDSSYRFSISPEAGVYSILDLSQFDIRLSASHSAQQKISPIEIPLRLQEGDINLDGYRDFIVFSKDQNSGTTRVVLLENIECVPAYCSEKDISLNRRTFRPMSGPQFEELYSISGAFGGAFLDIADDGTDDLLIMSIDSTTQEIKMHVLLNDLNEDAFFLKTMGLNGVCPSRCPGPVKFPNPRPFGVSQPGVTTKFCVADINGIKRPHSVAQLYHGSYLSLPKGYSLHGLGRTNDYVEYLFIGFPIQSKEFGSHEHHYQRYSAMIPNSQIIVFPYPPEKPQQWFLELLISPSDNVKYVIIAVSSCIVGLGGIILFLHWKERREDEAEKRKAEHFFTF